MLNKKARAMLNGMAAMAMLGASVPALAQARASGPSDYLKCDGQPNNMTAGESIGRLIGAVTLLGIFAPPAEGANPGSRLIGADGVAACTRLLDSEGAAAETNPERRIPLIIARAIHQIEAADYGAALADVAKARAEAATAGLTGNPLFERSTGRGISMIEAHARLRLGEIEAARGVALSGIFGLFGYAPFAEFSQTRTADEDLFNTSFTRLFPAAAFGHAARLEETGDFAAAALLREDMIGLNDVLGAKERASLTFANAAMAQGLAGNWERSNELAELARTNMETRVREGNPENNSSVVVEVLDLQTIARAAHEGRMAEARRLFTGRSSWPGVTFGSLVEVTRRLREGASEAELTGTLAMTPEGHWQRRRESEMASMIERDRDNRTLWRHLRTAPAEASYRAISRDVWRLDRSRLLLTENAEGWRPLIMPNAGGAVAGLDGMVLHAALQARHMGKRGFVMLSSPAAPQLALVRFGEPGDRGISETRFIDAAEAIAELEPIIPSPEVIRERERASRRRR
jgi:hypothetical protein